MSKLSLREIAQSQLDSTPVIDGQLIVCLDTGNAYRDTAMAHVKIGSDLEVVSDLPLAPLAEKLYYLKPDKLYVFLGGNWTLLNDKTIDLDEAIAKLPTGTETNLNDDVEIITQDTDFTQPHYYRRKLVVLWEYIKAKAQDFFAAKDHKHKKADITDFPTSMPASDVHPWAKEATKPSYTKSEVGLGKVDNTADADKTVKRATTAGTADTANSVTWENVKDKPTTFPAADHNHDSRYYTESEMDGKLSGKVNNTETGANGFLAKLTAWTANPTDDTYFIRQDTGGKNQFGRVKFSTLWNYIKDKADGTYQPKGSYAASSHTHDDRYYTESEMDGKLAEKLYEETITDARDLNTIKTTGVYHLKTTSYTNGPGVSNHATLFVDYTVGTPYQIFIPDSVNRAWRRNHVNSNDTWSAWTELKYTDTNTWRGIQNNLTSDSTTDSLSAAQGKALKALIDSKAPNGHTHSFSSITDKPSTYTPSAHNQSWSTITDKPALMESGDYSAETIEALLKRIQGLSPRMGSCCLAKDTHVANTWWNFIYTPHRTGSGGDNPDYGTLLLFPMTGTGSSYIIRAGKDGAVKEVRKIYTSSDKPTKGDVGLGNVDNTADANKSVKYATSAGSASSATKATSADKATTSRSLQLLSSTRPTSMNFNLADSDYLGKITYQIASSSTTTGKPPVDSGVLNFSWDNSGWGAQVAVANSNNPRMYVRGAISNNGASKWDASWKMVAYTDDAMTPKTHTHSFDSITGKPSTYPPSAHSHAYLPLGGGIMTGQIKKDTGGSWIGDRDRVLARSHYSGDWAYGAVAGIATKSGFWTMGNLGGDERLIFNYSTDSNYSAGKNETSQVYLPAQTGTIITSATIGSQTVASAGNATTWAGLSLRQNHNTSDTWIPVFSNNAVDYILKSEIVPDWSNGASKANSISAYGFYGASGASSWYHLCNITTGGDASNTIISVLTGNGYNGGSSQNDYFQIILKDGWQSSASASSAIGVLVLHYPSGSENTSLKVMVRCTAANKCSVYLFLPWGYWNGNYWVSGNYSSWENVVSKLSAEPTTGTAQDVRYEWITTQDRISYVKDSNDGGATTFAYSKAGMGYGDYTWLAAWNGKELRAVNKNQFAQAHSHPYLPLGGGTLTGDIAFSNCGTGTRQILFTCADNDYGRIAVGGTASNAGYMEIATADDGTEPIYVRQYSGIYANIVRSATLLDGSGNTTFPGAVTANTYYAPNWFRATGNSGFYFENHGGGWYMTDDTWIRAYNSKNIYTPGVIQCDGGFNGNLNGNANTATLIRHQGNVTAISGTDKRTAGLQLYGAYANGYPMSYGNVICASNGAFGSEIALDCVGGGGKQGPGRMYYRNRSDWTTSEWSDWATVAYLTDKVAGANHADSADSATALYMNSAGNGNSIYGSGNDAVNGPGGGLNNVVISSWYGVSFTSPCGYTYGGKNQTAVGIDCREGIVKAARFDGSLNGTATNAEYLGNDAAYMRMHWNGQGGQPTWLWGGNDASNMYVWNPSNFSVNYANSAGNGVTASGSNYVRFGNGTQICWGYNNENNRGGTTSFAVAFNNTSYALALTSTVKSDNAPFITGRSTTSFSYDRNGVAWDDVQWIAVGTWK